MDVLELIDETFDKDRSELYELSIQVSLNGFSFAVKDTIRNTFIVLVSKPFVSAIVNHQNWDEAVNDIVSSHPYLSLKYKKVLFEYSVSNFTLVPTDLFEADKAKTIFELANPLPEYFELHHTAHTNGSSFIQIFALPYTLSSAWLKVQPRTKFISPLSSLLFYSEISKTEQLVQLDIADGRIILVYHSNGALVASNTFEIKSENDIVYFLLNFCKSLKVESSNVHLHISGAINEYKDLQRLLFGYFSHTSMDAHYNSLHFTYQLLRHRVHFFKLFNSSSICE